jgi:hypothetical protein
VELVVGRAQAGKHRKPVCALSSICATLSCDGGTAYNGAHD